MTPIRRGVTATGSCVVDKPAGLDEPRRGGPAAGSIFGQRRVGHAGTLDPDATGVLLVGVGRATRLMRFVADLVKSYEGEVVLGTETSTLDAAGEVVPTYDMAESIDDVRLAATSTSSARSIRSRRWCRR